MTHQKSTVLGSLSLGSVLVASALFTSTAMADENKVALLDNDKNIVVAQLVVDADVQQLEQAEAQADKFDVHGYLSTKFLSRRPYQQ